MKIKETQDVTERIKFLKLLGKIEHELKVMIRDRHYMNDIAIKQSCEELIDIIHFGIKELEDSDD